MKKGDPGRPVIPIVIGPYTFDHALCDYGSSINIMPKVIYEKIHGSPLLYTTMCLQLADQSLCYPKGILEDICVRVGNSYVPADFVVVDDGGDEKSPIILGRPFLSTAKAIIYNEQAKICFTIKGRKEVFKFKNKALEAPAHPQCPYGYEFNLPRNNRRRNKKKQPQGARMINAIDSEWDYAAESPFLPKMEDPRNPEIE